MKKYHFPIVFAFIICLFMSFSSCVADSSDTDIVLSLQIDNPIMLVNGKQAEIDEGEETKPIISNGNTLVPIRAIIETFGGNVNWNEKTQTVTLNMTDDTIKLIIGSDTGYLNNLTYTLDTAPTIINGRTMLPIRFIAEGFNLGVAWDGKTQTVSIIRNTFDDKDCDALKKQIPEYSGQPYAVINNNIPFFESYEIINGSFEYYSELDPLGRCNVCMASINTDIMPTEKRESISSVHPTGWINKSYAILDNGYLYNRCHLIGYQLTGENANERNLITGTAYMNVDGMLPFENMVDDYVDSTHSNVMYRATPVFFDDNLVADGVLLEAQSVEDNGLSFCVYCYNVQPNITIDYATGESSANTSATTSGKTETHFTVYRTQKGKKYHYDKECAGKNAYKTTLTSSVFDGLEPCKKCVKIE